ncbi:hypothetical protein N7499_002518 [Penicillium canescens]|uniref:Uncharacterized protein n=1 Tax=Penicillium canescens TaxID=5083 RepID=A0AAD6N791_PENCN|nr:uncharacterized protein N7446_010121 [Penicillium canescens]KAJ6001579.1 hypothetical protein N7522_006806 [Penicillium canescens]KAJ6035362.1 hypothetical protein N7460_009537 [Penicillium canescens]KAJ6037489.1 hypothetical protein N7444_010194 [Penicillium canescens]KAJ6054109.1 hypothetical protein N7446_010121 [Penicillium canescens]KAJ6098144.1 hypothetical protein N7499_002518 [Penicillium canescens]
MPEAWKSYRISTKPTQAMVKARIANWSDAHLEKSILAAKLAGADVVEAADDTEALDSDWLVPANQNGH